MPGKKKKPAKSRLSNEQLDNYIDGIFDGSITADDLPQFVYEQIADYMKEGIYKGFGYDLEELQELADEKGGSYITDLELLKDLRENVYMFGAAKTYAMTKEISSFLFDEDGKLRTNKEFNEIARDTYAEWNDNWGETEYSTAIGQSYAAKQWRRIEDQKQVLPMLTYSAIGDACEICAPLDGLTRPVDDPVWTTISPLNHFNCKCLLEQHDEAAIVTDDDETIELFDHATSKMDAVFASNPGQDGSVFNEHHPYFEEARRDGQGKDNFGFDIPKND